MDSFTSNMQQTTQTKLISTRNVATLARGLMNQWGLQDWTFKLDNAKRRAGCCKYSRKTISLSRFYVDNNTDADIRDTLLHVLY